jgi:hypothetical protein
MLDLVDLGASGLNETNNTVWVQCKGAPVAEDEAPDYGQTLYMPCLGVAGRPAPANDAGSAQAVVAEVPGYSGVCIGAYDPRASKIFGKIGPGETAVFSTGDGYDSQILLKDQLLAMIVGNDMVTVMDRKKKQIAWAVGGYAGNVSEENGWLFLDKSGTAGIQIKDGCVYVFGQVVLGGRTPVTPVAMQAVGANGAASLPAAGVFIGA